MLPTIVLFMISVGWAILMIGIARDPSDGPVELPLYSWYLLIPIATEPAAFFGWLIYAFKYPEPNFPREKRVLTGCLLVFFGPSLIYFGLKAFKDASAVFTLPHVAILAYWLYIIWRRWGQDSRW